MKSLKKGFTLVELIIVITILVVLATIAFITLGDYPVQSRDSKRISDIANIAKKVSIITADGNIKHKELTKQATADTTVSGYKIYAWDIDFKNLKESEKAFAGPLTDEKYQIIIVNDNNDANVCFEVGARVEKSKDGKDVVFNGTCNPQVSEVSGMDAKLFSGTFTTGLRTN